MLIDALVTFAVATVASFIGSLQAGLVNTAVLAHTVQRGPAAGRRMAIGGSIPEFLYAGAAHLFANAILDRLGIGQEGITNTVGAVLIGMGIWFLFIFKPKLSPMNMELKASGVRKGLLIGLANPQLLLFWCGVVLALHAYGIAGQGLVGTLAFALGAFAGALVLLFQLVKLGRKAVEKLQPAKLHLLFRLVGALLVLSGAVAILR